MGRTACTEPQCLYKGALYLFNPPNNNTNMITLKFNFNILLLSVLLTDNTMEKHFYTLYNSVGKDSKQRLLTSLVAGLPTWFPTALSTFRFRSCPLPGAFSFLTASFSPLSCLLLIFLFLSSPAKKSDHPSLSHVTVTPSGSRFCDQSERTSQQTGELCCAVRPVQALRQSQGLALFPPEYLNIMK